MTLLLVTLARAQQDAAPEPQQAESETGRAASPPPFFERQAEEANDQGPQSPGFNQLAVTGDWPCLPFFVAALQMNTHSTLGTLKHWGNCVKIGCPANGAAFQGLILCCMIETFMNRRQGNFSG